MVLFAAALLADSASSNDWPKLLDRYGLPVLLIGVLIVGGSKYLVPGWVHQRLISEYERERDDRVELERILRDDVVPAMVRSTEATAASTAAQERTARILERVERRLDQAGRP